MIKYYCNNCKVEMESSECSICGERTEMQSDIYWCEHCNIPIYEENCTICNSKGMLIGTDLRPVFPEERLLLEILINEPFKYKNSSVWNVAGNRYIVDGKKLKYPQTELMNKDPEKVISELDCYEKENSYDIFYKYVERFVKANTSRYNFLVTEATNFIIEQKKNI
ncbi:MAG: hypothetical protein ACLR3R_17520 [Clostridium paraputrificum]